MAKSLNVSLCTEKKISDVRVEVVKHVAERLGEELLVYPEIHFLANLAALQYAGLAHELEVVRHRRARQSRNFGDLPDVELLTRFEQQQDALPVFVAHRSEGAGDLAPRRGDGFHVMSVHIDN